MNPTEHSVSPTTYPAATAGAPSPSTELNVHDLMDATRRLRSLTTHIESFLSGQLQRLSDAMNVYTQVKTEAETVRRLFADLESERMQWQTQREAELVRLQSASENLVTAWDMLDTQQRQLLLDQRRGEASYPSVASRGTAGRRPELAAPGRLPAQLESTLLEIQMLKREMIDHAQRRR